MSFILDALRKLEEKRAPETTRELLAAGIPGPHKISRGKPLWPYIVTAALAANLLAAAGWFALKQRAGGGEGEPPAGLSSRNSGEDGNRASPDLSNAEGGTRGKTGTAPALPRPLPDTPGDSPLTAAPENLPPEGEGRMGEEGPEMPSSSGAIDNAPLPAEDGDGSAEPLMASSTGMDEAPSPGKSAAPSLLPLDELPEAVRGSLKDLRIEGHVYSDDPDFRLLSIDGTLKREGDTVRPGLLIETISPEGAVFTYRGYRFSMKGY